MLVARVTPDAAIGLWRSLVARLVRDEEAAGSNPVSPTNVNKKKERCGPHACDDGSVMCRVSAYRTVTRRFSA
jgi:hypothetical protein